jgi:hypothetical protein
VGDTRIAARCSDGEPMRACVDATLMLLDKAKSLQALRPSLLRRLADLRVNNNPAATTSFRPWLAARNQMGRLSGHCPQRRRASPPMGAYYVRLLARLHAHPGCRRRTAGRCRRSRRRGDPATA